MREQDNISERIARKYEKKNSNRLGHNRHTPKNELVGKPINPYRKMTKEDLLTEAKRLNDEKRYHQAMGLKYAQKVSFIFEVLGIEPKKSEADRRADKDFREREGIE